MNWKASPPAIESAAVWTASLCLGGAMGFAVARIAPFGAGLAEAGAAGALVALTGGLLVARLGERGAPRAPAIADSLNDLLLGDDVLTLQDRVDDEVLLLDDPLPAVGDESRVVRLFALPAGPGEAATPLAGPGEMISRIEDFLGHVRGSAPRAEPLRSADPTTAEDASAALHAALADIRRSLKKG